MGHKSITMASSLLRKNMCLDDGENPGQSSVDLVNEPRSNESRLRCVYISDNSYPQRAVYGCVMIMVLGVYRAGKQLTDLEKYYYFILCLQHFSYVWMYT